MSFTGSTLASAATPNSDQQTDPSQPAPAAPDISAVQPNGPRFTSLLSRIVGVPTPTPPPAQPAWKNVLGKVASVVSTGMAGISDKGRPSFVSGLGEGARSAQAQQAQQQEIKFKSFDDQVRAAQLHNEDLRMQWATDAHQDAVQAQADAEAERMTKTTGLTYTKVSNTAKDATNYLTADAAQNGGASVPPGTIFGPHAMYIPNKGSADQAQSLTKDYNWRGPAYGLSSVQPGQVVQPGAYDQLRQASNGLDNQGHPMSAADIGNRVDNLTSYLKANQGIPDQAKSAIQSDIDHLTDLQTHHASRDEAAITQANKDYDARKAIDSKYKEQDQDNKDGNKNQGVSPTPDPFGVTSSLPAKEATKRYDTFSKAYVQPLTKVDQQLSQFANIQSDIDKNGNMTGAESVVGLFNAIGISASPLKGMGFRINNNTVEEHANARGLGQSLYQKLLGLKSGDVVTPQQLKDYASIANQARESQYSSAIDEARRQNLPVDFLPKGNGSQIDPSTARMYMRAANGDPNKARTAAQQAGWRMGQ